SELQAGRLSRSDRRELSSFVRVGVVRDSRLLLLYEKQDWPFRAQWHRRSDAAAAVAVAAPNPAPALGASETPAELAAPSHPTLRLAEVDASGVEVGLQAAAGRQAEQHGVAQHGGQAEQGQAAAQVHRQAVEAELAAFAGHCDRDLHAASPDQHAARLAFRPAHLVLVRVLNHVAVAFGHFAESVLRLAQLLGQVEVAPPADVDGKGAARPEHVVMVAAGQGEDVGQAEHRTVAQVGVAGRVPAAGQVVRRHPLQDVAPAPAQLTEIDAVFHLNGELADPGQGVPGCAGRHCAVRPVRTRTPAVAQTAAGGRVALSCPTSSRPEAPGRTVRVSAAVTAAAAAALRTDCHGLAPGHRGARGDEHRPVHHRRRDDVRGVPDARSRTLRTTTTFCSLYSKKPPSKRLASGGGCDGGGVGGDWSTSEESIGVMQLRQFGQNLLQQIATCRGSLTTFTKNYPADVYNPSTSAETNPALQKKPSESDPFSLIYLHAKSKQRAMTEETIVFHFYAKKLLSDSELLNLAAIAMESDSSQVKSALSGPAGDDLQLDVFTNGANKVLNIRRYESQNLYVFDILVMRSRVKIDLVLIRHLEELIKKFLTDIGSLDRLYCMLGPIRRGEALWRYFPMSDGRIVEFNLGRLVEDRQTKYQNVKIYWSEVHGHAMFLDDDIMLAEKDQEPYTRVLLGLETGKPARNCYADKEILILGGGDGGVICELLKQQPRMVTMVEIDSTVVQLCAKYMRGACEDALDTLEGPNKKIIIGDCLDHLHECIQSGKKYDYIINDLTEFMVNKEERGWNYDFATDNCQMMEIALKALKPDGCYILRGGSLSYTHFWSCFEDDCRKLGLRFRVYDSYVPAFYDKYRFYEVRFA
uniref:PABS domain-containing protein n=1 Tax=Macrostomum lignano TaxID=282301 RepID=A0A1I8ISB5_9PLAT